MSPRKGPFLAPLPPSVIGGELPVGSETLAKAEMDFRAAAGALDPRCPW